MKRLARTTQKRTFKVLFGLDLELMRAVQEHSMEMERRTILLSKAIQSVEEMTGGDGWTEMAQNAISLLSAKSDHLESVLEMHHDAISQVMEEITTPELSNEGLTNWGPSSDIKN